MHTRGDRRHPMWAGRVRRWIGGSLVVLSLALSLALVLWPSPVRGVRVPETRGKTVRRPAGSLRRVRPSRKRPTDAVRLHPAGQSPVPALQRSAPEAKVVWFVPVSRPEVFITIDDGWFPSRRVVAYMVRHHLPVTAFVIQQAMQEHPHFWRSFVQAGGGLEDHTYSHPLLTGLGFAADRFQVQSAATAIQALSGTAPVLFRPPYGGYNPTVLQAVYASGIPDVVMWDAVMANAVQGYRSYPIQTWNGQTLAPGEIVLLHWVPGLYGALRHLLAVIAADHLVVGNLLHHLPVDNGPQAAVPGNTYGAVGR